jgi:hypothetical protein
MRCAVRCYRSSESHYTDEFILRMKRHAWLTASCCKSLSSAQASIRTVDNCFSWCVIRRPIWELICLVICQVSHLRMFTSALLGFVHEYLFKGSCCLCSALTTLRSVCWGTQRLFLSWGDSSSHKYIYFLNILHLLLCLPSGTIPSGFAPKFSVHFHLCHVC